MFILVHGGVILRVLTRTFIAGRTVLVHIRDFLLRRAALARVHVEALTNVLPYVRGNRHECGETKHGRREGVEQRRKRTLERSKYRKQKPGVGYR